MFTKFSLCVGRQGIHVSSFIFHSVFLCQLHAIKNVGREFFVVFQETQCLHIFNHDDVCHTELYLSTKFYVCQCCG